MNQYAFSVFMETHRQNNIDEKINFRAIGSALKTKAKDVGSKAASQAATSAGAAAGGFRSQLKTNLASGQGLKDSLKGAAGTAVEKGISSVVKDPEKAAALTQGVTRFGGGLLSRIRGAIQSSPHSFANMYKHMDNSTYQDAADEYGNNTVTQIPSLARVGPGSGSGSKARQTGNIIDPRLRTMIQAGLA